MRKIKYIFNSVKGINRFINQDYTYFIKTPEYQLFMVFDGVSSNEFSLLFIKSFTRIIEEKHNLYNKEGAYDLRGLIYDANNQLIHQGINGLTTIVALSIDDTGISCVSIGDTRLYSYSESRLKQLTKDDSFGGNIITKALGQERGINDIEVLTIRDDFKYLLIATDGFYKILESNYNYFSNTLERFVYLKNIAKRFEKLVFGVNSDDSTYLLIK